jgi:cell shape-determining protein MreC
MNTIDILKNKVLQNTKEFNFLLQENNQLKHKLEQLQEKNDILTRKSEDLILSINSRLRQEDN